MTILHNIILQKKGKCVTIKITGMGGGGDGKMSV